MRDSNRRQHRFEQARIFEGVALRRGQRAKQREVARNRTHIEKEESILDTVEVGFLDPGMEIVLPYSKWLSPSRITRHVIAGAERISASCKSLLREGGEPLEVFARRTVIAAIRVDERVVLVGLESLLAAPLASHHHPAIRSGRSSNLFFCKLQNLCDKPIVHFGHDACHMTRLCTLTQQQWQQSGDPVLCACQSFHACLRINKSNYIQRRFALQHH